ncbi:MAG TPA: N-acetylmuramoyl-L-alanine amidase [Chthoniobacterales bacterium]
MVGGLIGITALCGSLFWHFFLDNTEAGRNFQTVVIDAGHGGQDSGAVAFGLDEKSLNLDVALKLAEVLRAQGIEVALTRDSDYFVSLGDRARIANRQKNSIFVSIHFNHTGISTTGGVETYRAEFKSPGIAEDVLNFLRVARPMASINLREEALAQAVQMELVSATGTTDRGIKRRNFYVIRRTASPALLIEGGFLSNPTTVRRLKTQGYREVIAAAIARGILKYRAGWEPSPRLLASEPSP